jgi:hypothetical protein
MLEYAFESATNPHVGYKWIVKGRQEQYETPELLVDYKSPTPEHMDVVIRTYEKIHMYCSLMYNFTYWNETEEKKDEDRLRELDENDDHGLVLMHLEKMNDPIGKKGIVINYGCSAGWGGAGIEKSIYYYSTLLIQVCKINYLAGKEIDIVIAVLKSGNSDVFDVDYYGYDAIHYAKTPEIKYLLQCEQAYYRRRALILGISKQFNHR